MTAKQSHWCDFNGHGMSRLNQNMRAAPLLAIAVVTTGYVLLFWPDRPVDVTGSATAISAAPLAEVSDNLQVAAAVSRSTDLTQAEFTQADTAKTAGGKTKTARCDQDSTQISIQFYRKLAPTEWRRLNDWQRERGLSQTRLGANGELAQEPSPYLQYDTGTLRQLAINDDAEARYWLAMKYRESGQPIATLAGEPEDATLVITRLLSTAATLGHVQAMLAIGNGFYQQAVEASAPGQSPIEAYPDLLIKARAWQQVAAWRMGRLPDQEGALPADLEQQAGQLAGQLIADIEQSRNQQGLPVLDNVVPDSLIGLLQQISIQSCDSG